MKTTRSLFSLTILAAALALGACADGNAPKIKRFEASATSLPEGGADVTFTWDVSHAKSLELEPYPGAVTGTSATVTVTEATTFTLVAKNGGKKDSKRISFTVGEAFAVNGQAVDLEGFPVPGVDVFVDDHFVVTDENGYFSVSGVVPPYNLGYLESEGGVTGFGGPSGLEVTVFRDVTRPDPVMLVNRQAPLTAVAYVNGSVSGGEGFPFPTPTPDPDYAVSMDIAIPGGYAEISTDFTSSPDYNAILYFPNSGEPRPYTVGLLQYRREPQVVFTGFGREQGMISDGESLLDVDLALAPVGNGEITTTVTAPFIVNFAEFGGSLDFGALPSMGAGTLAGGLPYFFSESYELPGAELTSAGSMTLAIPLVPGGEISSVAYAFGEDGYASKIKYGLTDGANVTFDMPRLPTLLTPVNGASVGAGTVFSVAEIPDALYQHYFYSDGGGIFPAFGGFQPEINIVVLTEKSHTSFPDDLDLAGTPFEGRVFEWAASGIVGYGNDIDALLADGAVPPGDEIGLSVNFSGRTVVYGDPIGPF